jgi:intracellular multiplication protein IcmP
MDPMFSWMLLIGLAAVLCFALYKKGEPGLVNLGLRVKAAELTVIDYSQLDRLIPHTHVDSDGVVRETDMEGQALCARAALITDRESAVAFANEHLDETGAMRIPLVCFEASQSLEGRKMLLSSVSAVTGDYFKWLFGPLMIWIGIWILARSSQVRFKTPFTLDSFRKFQSDAWRMIAPVTRIDPFADKAGKWAVALTPQEWVKREKIDMIDIAPDREAARNALAKQLRRPWAGTDRLQPHERALLAVFALKMAQRTDECTALLARLSKGWTTHGSVASAMRLDIGLSGQVGKVIKDAKLGKQVLEHSRNHAFVESAFANMLKEARLRGGVLASAEFLWLKAEDRSLWYILNNVGRPTFHIESAGAIAHWKAEITTGRPLPEPDVDEAVFGLEEFFARHAA